MHLEHIEFSHSLHLLGQDLQVESVSSSYPEPQLKHFESLQESQPIVQQVLLPRVYPSKQD